MNSQQKLSVSYGSFSCDVVGFEDPLPVLQDVIGEFRQVAWRYPGFGAQKEGSQRDTLSRLVAAKLNASLSSKGIAVTVNDEDGGGLLVHPVDGADEVNGWGDLYAKPKPTPSGKKQASSAASAAPVAIAKTAEPVAEKISNSEPEIPPAVELVKEEAVEASAPEIDATTEAPLVEASEPVVEMVDKAAPEAEPEIAAEAELEVAPEVEPEVFAKAEPEVVAKAEPEVAEEVAEVHETEEAPAPAGGDGPTDEDLIAARVREEVASIVGDEIKDAFADFDARTDAADSAKPQEDAPKSGLFSRFLGAAKKNAKEEDAAPVATDISAMSAPATENLPEADEVPKGFAHLMSKDAPKAEKAPESTQDPERDYVFDSGRPDEAQDEPALVLSVAEPSDLDKPIGDIVDDNAQERAAAAKAKVMERAKERKNALVAADRRLRIIRRERVEEKSDDMAEAVAEAATGKPTMSAGDFAKLAGAASLQELMEASAAYATLVGGKHKFTRSDLMEVMSELDKDKSYSPEARIKSFGKMLRTGVLLRVDDGLFAMSQNHRHPYETKIHA